MPLSTSVALEADAAEYSALEQYARGVNFLTNPNASPTNQAMQSMCPRTADAFRPARICGPAAPAIKNKMTQQTAPQSEVRRTHLSRLSPSARGPREIGSPPHCRIGRGRGCAQEPRRRAASAHSAFMQSLPRHIYARLRIPHADVAVGAPALHFGRSYPPFLLFADLDCTAPAYDGASEFCCTRAPRSSRGLEWSCLALATSSPSSSSSSSSYLHHVRCFRFFLGAATRLA